MINDKPQSIWSQVDWLTIGLYIALMLFGWLSICGASYSFGDNDLFSLDTRSGMQSRSKYGAKRPKKGK